MTSRSISTCLLYKEEKFSQKSQVDFLFFSLVQIRSHDYLWEILYLIFLFLKLEAARAKKGARNGLCRQTTLSARKAFAEESQDV